MKKYLIYGIIVTIIFIIPIFIKTNYFFNPISLKSDEIINLPWWHYKKPIIITFNNKIAEKQNEFTDQDDIAFIFDKLKNSPDVNVENNYIAPIGEEGKNLVPIATIQIKSNQKNLRTFFIFNKEIFKVANKEKQPEYRRITDELWNFLNDG